MKTLILCILMIGTLSSVCGAQEHVPLDYGITSPEGFIVLTSGVLLMEAGMLFQTFAVNQYHLSLERQQEYLSGTVNLEDLYWEYADAASEAGKFNFASLLFMEAGALTLSSLLLLPPEKLTLSLAGRIGLGVSMTALLVGNYFFLNANNRLLEAKSYYEEYESGSSNLAETYALYESAYGAYNSSMLAGLIIKGAAGAGVVLSFVLPGQKRPVMPSPLQKILVGSAMACLAAGTFTEYAALSSSGRLNLLWSDYINASSNVDALYGAYQTEYTKYAVLTGFTYGLWAAGGAALITALFLPPRSGTAEPDLPFNVSVAPTAYGGLTLGVALTL